MLGLVFVAACAPAKSTSTAEPSASVGASWAECPRFDAKTAVQARMANDLSCPDADVTQFSAAAGTHCRDACPDWIAGGCGKYAAYAVEYTFEYHANCATSVRLMGPPRDATRR